MMKSVRNRVVTAVAAGAVLAACATGGAFIISAATPPANATSDPGDAYTQAMTSAGASDAAFDQQTQTAVAAYDAQQAQAAATKAAQDAAAALAAQQAAQAEQEQNVTDTSTDATDATSSDAPESPGTTTLPSANGPVTGPTPSPGTSGSAGAGVNQPQPSS